MRTHILAILCVSFAIALIANSSSSYAITPCSSNVRTLDPTSEAGIACRTRNIDLYNQSLREFGGFDADKLQSCLNNARREIQGLNNTGRGGGPRYFRILDKCRQIAKIEGRKINLDSANDDSQPDDTPQPAVSCDADCAADLFRSFMEENPEPGDANDDQ